MALLDSKEQMKQNEISRNLALHALSLSRKKKTIDDNDYELIKQRIDQSNDNLNVIVNVLMKSAYLGKKITDKIISDTIILEFEMERCFGIDEVTIV